MTTPRYTRAVELAAELDGAGCHATADVRDVGTTPVVLVGPPSIDWTLGTYAGGQFTWTLTVLAGTTSHFEGWLEVDELLAALEGTGIVIQNARPAFWAAAADQEPRPAYVVTYEETAP